MGGIVEGGFDAARRGRRGALRHAAPRASDDGARRGPFLHPGKAAETDAGWLGELHPALLEGEWGVFELDRRDPDGAGAGPHPLRRRDHVPGANQDVAVVVDDEVEAQALVDTVLEAGAPELRRAQVFDVYRGEQVGEGRKSVALHLAFQAPDRTLSDEDAAAVRERVVAALAERFSAELRG